MAPKVAPLLFHSGRRAGAGFRRPVPVEVNLPLLEIGVQAIQLSPYHAGPPARRPGHLDPATGFLACSCPLHLSDPGKPSDPGTSLRVPPGYAGDTTRRLAAQPRQKSAFWAGPAVPVNAWYRWGVC